MAAALRPARPAQRRMAHVLVNHRPLVTPLMARPRCCRERGDRHGSRPHRHEGHLPDLWRRRVQDTAASSSISRYSTAARALDGDERQAYYATDRTDVAVWCPAKSDRSAEGHRCAAGVLARVGARTGARDDDRTARAVLQALESLSGRIGDFAEPHASVLAALANVAMRRQQPAAAQRLADRALAGPRYPPPPACCPAILPALIAPQRHDMLQRQRGDLPPLSAPENGRQIAQALFITTKTAAVHLTCGCRKTGHQPPRPASRRSGQPQPGTRSSRRTRTWRFRKTPQRLIGNQRKPRQPVTACHNPPQSGAMPLPETSSRPPITSSWYPCSGRTCGGAQIIRLGAGSRAAAAVHAVGGGRAPEWKRHRPERCDAGLTGLLRVRMTVA